MFIFFFLIFFFFYLNAFILFFFFFFFNDTATTEIYTLSLHDALPILAQNCSHRPGVYDKARKLSTNAAPRSRHLAPERHSRIFTSVLHAASVTPLPIGSPLRTRRA